MRHFLIRWLGIGLGIMLFIQHGKADETFVLTAPGVAEGDIRDALSGISPKALLVVTTQGSPLDSAQLHEIKSYVIGGIALSRILKNHPELRMEAGAIFSDRKKRTDSKAFDNFHALSLEQRNLLSVEFVSFFSLMDLLKFHPELMKESNTLFMQGMKELGY